ncbi:flagellar hook basal-body protein [Novosphingobium sp.]|uniref:flagellar hook-basal body protein n=1 Tax=Novosphingobium sp. TaxID=1874826 RepID=UPI0025FEDAE5|nr:flagellar hook basal-body protein [Novosphingobium sp.]MCC6924591.1 flagellar hook basal-body protein [Novosphingobium sp.]
MSFYTSLNGLKNAQTELSVIANNLANAETTGFKKSRVNFADIVSSSAATNPKLVKGIGSTVLSIDQNFSLGPVQQTGAALDLAIDGEGFFTKVSPITGKTFYTRNGNFSLDGAGFITDSVGSRLQILPVDAAGAVTSLTPQDAAIPLTNGAGSDFVGVTVNTDGSLIASYADGTTQSVGKVALAAFVAPTGLLQLGNQDWGSTGISGPASYNQPGAARFGNIRSGSLEQSNVDIAEEMVGLITAQRYFQANAKAIDTATQLSQTIVNLRT